MRIVVCLLLLAISTLGNAQFSPDGGQPWSIAIHADSVNWLGFATEVELALGWLDVADTTLGRIDVIVSDAGIGSPDFVAQPLGDGGCATARFAVPIKDQSGYDFVVFENGFATSDTTGFFELAFVEVSSNGVHFFRFPSMSLSNSEDFAGSFAELDSRLIDGLAGRFSAPYGAPFDLADLANDPHLDKSAVQYVRVIDVVGSEDPAFAKTDSEGMLIIDPYPTPFSTGGFDLDAIGVLDAHGTSVVEEYPAFAKTTRTVIISRGQQLQHATSTSSWVDALGRIASKGPTAPLATGFYFVGEYDHQSEWKRVFVY